MDYLIVVLFVVIAYLFGGIPSGYLIVKKVKGIDIRTVGSGNIGSTNVKRVLGAKYSILTLICDIVKGAVPMLIIYVILSKINLSIDKELIVSICAVVAILGHNYTPYLGFHGGKGVNTTIGVFLILSPVATLSGAFIYFFLKLFTKIVSIRSMLLGLTIIIVTIILRKPVPYIVATILAELIMIYRHKENIIRLIRHEEK